MCILKNKEQAKQKQTPRYREQTDGGQREGAGGRQNRCKRIRRHKVLAKHLIVARRPRRDTSFQL